MYKLLISSNARKEIKKLKKIYQESIISALSEIKDDPLSGKPLGRELDRRFSYRIGTYRIIYKINQKDELIQILSAGHRSNIYN